MTTPPHNQRCCVYKLATPCSKWCLCINGGNLASSTPATTPVWLHGSGRPPKTCRPLFQLPRSEFVRSIGQTAWAWKTSSLARKAVTLHSCCMLQLQSLHHDWQLRARRTSSKVYRIRHGNQLLPLTLKAVHRHNWNQTATTDFGFCLTSPFSGYYSRLGQVPQRLPERILGPHWSRIFTGRCLSRRPAQPTVSKLRRDRNQSGKQTDMLSA